MTLDRADPGTKSVHPAVVDTDDGSDATRTRVDMTTHDFLNYLATYPQTWALADDLAGIVDEHRRAVAADLQRLIA
jgi:hypothetical protein